MSELIDTLKRSLTLSRDLLYRHTTCSEELAKVEQLLSLLSDRSALLWALLEEEAGEVVERRDYGDRTVWNLLDSSETLAQFRKDALPGRFRFWFPGGWSQESTTQAQALAMLCAIQEQKRREVSGE